MSTRYNTGNPIESTDVRDMSDNAKNFDEFVNSASDEFTDRLGIERKTIHGMNSEFDSQILNVGFTRVGTFAAGATLTNPRQTLLWDIADGGDGQEYGWSGSFPPSGKVVSPGSTPLTTGGIAVGAWMSRFDPQLSVQAREALRRSYAEAGYLVKGAFVAGEKVDSATDVLIDEATGNGHSHSGPYPHTVVVGETPASAGWSDKSGDVLRSQLASPVGTNLIGLSAGGVLTDAIKNVAYLDAYEHLVVSGDWSAALQAALDTGLPLVPNPTVTYNVNGIIQSKGNRIIGPLNINPTRPGLSDLGAFTFNGEQGGGFQKNLKLLYVFKVYDLIEFMYIRSMGFNAILHVGALYVDRPELNNDTLKDALKLALDNAQTAGLSVNMHTGWEIATDGMAIDYVNTFSPHPAVFGFSVFDEPTWNGVSVARQSERLTALRAITEKNLNCVDSIANYSSYRNGYNPWTHGYDIMFVDAYSHTTPGATLLENINNDLRNMRRDVGVAAVYCPGSKIIPVCGLFKSTSFSADFQQIKATSSKLVRAAGGDFGVWAWDPLDPVVTAGVRTDTDLRALSKTFCEIVMNGDRIPKAYRIGGTGQNPDSIPPCAARDGVFVVQKQDGAPTFVQSGTTCLGVLRPGTDAEFAFNGLSFPIGGILFKGTYPVAITNIPMQQYMTTDFELVDVTGSQSGTMYFHYTQDEGATTSPEALSFGFVFTPSVPALSKSLYFGTGEYWRGNKLVVALAVNEPAQEAFRICMHGFIVTSEW